VPLGSSPADQIASSTKSSSMLVKPVTVRPLTSGSPLDKVAVAKYGDAVAQRGGDLARLEELRELGVQIRRLSIVNIGPSPRQP